MLAVWGPMRGLEQSPWVAAAELGQLFCIDLTSLQFITVWLRGQTLKADGCGPWVKNTLEGAASTGAVSNRSHEMANWSTWLQKDLSLDPSTSLHQTREGVINGRGDILSSCTWSLGCICIEILHCSNKHILGRQHREEKRGYRSCHDFGMVTELIVLMASERLQDCKLKKGGFKSQRFNTAHCNALLENLFRTVKGLQWHFVLGWLALQSTWEISRLK